MTKEELRVLYVKSNNNGFLDFEKFAKLVNNSFNVDFPTADEVCKALSEYLGCDVTYNNYVFLMVKDTSIKDLANDKRFDLITLIGRFYEGLEEMK